MTVRRRWRSILERSTQMVQLRLHNWARYTGSPRSGWVPLPQASYNILASPLAISFFLSRAGHWQEWLVKRPEFPAAAGPLFQGNRTKVFWSGARWPFRRRFRLHLALGVHGAGVPACSMDGTLGHKCHANGVTLLGSGSRQTGSVAPTPHRVDVQPGSTDLQGDHRQDAGSARSGR